MLTKKILFSLFIPKLNTMELFLRNFFHSKERTSRERTCKTNMDEQGGEGSQKLGISSKHTF